MAERKKTRWIQVAIVAVMLIMVGLLGVIHETSIIKKRKAVERGRYLSESVAICFECHSERNFSQPGWPIPSGRMGVGRILRGEGTSNPIVAPNITSDPETGVGAWTDDDLRRVLRDGIGRSGKRINPEMPYKYFQAFSDNQIDDIIAFLRTLPPVHNQLPLSAQLPAGDTGFPISMDNIKLLRTSPEITRGAFLVKIGACETCHTPSTSDGYIKGMEFAGGTVFTHEKASIATSNLTFSTSGIAYYSPESFISVLQTGRAGPRPIFSAMPWLFYGKMSVDDLRAIHAYLEALPPITHVIDNAEAPVRCRKCLNTHGGGDRN